MHYDEVELEEMDYDHDIGAYTYPCPCGDIFSLDPDVRLSDTVLLAMHSTFSPKRHHLSLPLSLTSFSLQAMREGEVVAPCSSCSLFITVIHPFSSHAPSLNTAPLSVAT